jgi:hypothetical protein
MNGWSLSNENPSVLRDSREYDADFGISGYGGIRSGASFAGLACDSGLAYAAGISGRGSAATARSGETFSYAEIVIKLA